jgi:hypothetical protein
MNDDDSTWLLDVLYEYSSKDISLGKKMSYYDKYALSYTRDGDVAKAAIEALEKGHTLDQLLNRNRTVRAWHSQLQSDRNAELLRMEREKELRQKAAEKKKLEDAKRLEAVSKLTPEEREAFGLNEKGYHKR